MNKKELNNIKKYVYVFKSIENAISWSMKSRWPGYIIHGDDGRYWACRPVDFNKLVKAGYKAVDLKITDSPQE